MTITILHGDCLDMMAELAPDSFDAIVTDPPYELGFMGKQWDASGVAYRVDLWEEALRVLKPGGHLLAFGGTRTYHRLACAIEDAGFEIRDQLQWLYGSGFPKSLDVSKAIDKAAGADRAVVGYHERADLLAGRAGFRNLDGERIERGAIPLTAPATPEAERWQGWGTALKPANEPIVLARKPLSEPTVAANVLRWGTGALNVDACRVSGAGYTPGGQNRSIAFGMSGMGDKQPRNDGTAGRWPANVILSHSLFCTDDACAEDCPVALLDAQSGASRAARVPTERGTRPGGFGNIGHDKGSSLPNGPMYGDSGGASRFYYVAKASRRERRGSKHPTVKPVQLMRYLIRLVTPPGGTILDPFAGSGTTGEAAQLEGVGAVLIEREAEYVADIHARLGIALDMAADG